MKYELLALKENDDLNIAVLAENELVEYYPQTAQKVQSGDIYRGRVERTVPGLEAAFVNLGPEMGFIYAKEVLKDKHLKEHNVLIDALLKPGQEIVVQVVKEAVGDKRAGLTAQISLPGEYIVLLPDCPQRGISRKITDEQKRALMLARAQQIHLRQQAGFILRTNAQEADITVLQKEYDALLSQWQMIKSTKGRLLYKADDLLRTLRQDLSGKLGRVWTNDEDVYQQWRQDSSVPVFLKESEYLRQKFALDYQLHKALQKKVALASGGFLIIDETEAMVVIDVNSGSFAAKEGLEKTFLKLNTEAAREIARQIRLRNLGGIIIIDFIDMAAEESRREVAEALAKAVQEDRRKINLEGWSALGLFEMTRQKKGQPLSRSMGRICPHCQGLGRIYEQ